MMVITKVCKLIICFALMVIFFSPNPAYAEQENLSESEILCKSGLDYYNKGQYDLAIINNTKAIELNPQFARAYNNRGLAYYMIDKNRLAVADYTKAIELNPQHAFAYYNRGRAYRMQVKYKLSLDDFNKAIELNPEDKDYYLERAHAYECTGLRYRLAVDDYNRVLTMDPNNRKAYNEKFRIIRYGSGEVYDPSSVNIRDTSYNPF